MGNGCTTILTKDSLEENLNIKKETYSYNIYKKSRTNKCTNKIHKTTNKKKTKSKKIKSNNKSLYNLENKLENINIEINENKLVLEKTNKKFQEFNINEYLDNKKRLKELNNYINKLETELMNHTINNIKEKIQNLNNEKITNNTINNLKCKNAKLFHSYLELKKSTNSC